MKKATFKTLSILLAAVILVVVLPVTAFAEDVSPCNYDLCDHSCIWIHITEHLPYSDELHKNVSSRIYYCTLCHTPLDKQIKGVSYDYHVFDSYDPEVDMQVSCTICGHTIYW